MTPSSIVDIQVASVEDLPQAGRINYLSTIDTYPSIIPTFKHQEISVESRISSIEQWFEKNDTPRRVFIAYEGNHPIGYAACCHREFMGFLSELTSFHVLPAYRRKGIGKLLFSEVTKWLIQSEVYSLFLEAYRDNPFLYFYDKVGGKIVAELRQYRYGSNVSVVVYGWNDLRGINKE